MTTSNQYNKNWLRILFLTCVILGIYSCSDNDSDKNQIPANEVKWNNTSTVGAAEGYLGMVISGVEGTEWNAEIIDGADWCSFGYSSTVASASGAVAEGLNVQYVYYGANTGHTQRSARVSFTIDSQQPDTLMIIQYSRDPHTEPLSGRWAELPT